MKRAHYTISYVVYPANYKPGDGYKRAKNKVAAMRLARGFGPGAAIHRNLSVRHTPCRQLSFKARVSSYSSYAWHMTLERIERGVAHWSRQ